MKIRKKKSEKLNAIKACSKQGKKSEKLIACCLDLTLLHILLKFVFSNNIVFFLKDSHTSKILECNAVYTPSIDMTFQSKEGKNSKGIFIFVRSLKPRFSTMSIMNRQLLHQMFVK